MDTKHAGVGSLYVNQLLGSLNCFVSFLCHVYILHVLEGWKSVDGS